MKPEQQRIAIAEACGWKGWYCTKCKKQVPPGQVAYDEHHSDPDDSCGGLCESSPDYLNDLNAMHDAEKVLNEKQEDIMNSTLWDIMDGRKYLWHATASQRAEAFLRTIGKWKEAKP